MTFIKRYGTLFRFLFENVLNKKSKLYLPFHRLTSDNGEVVIINITRIKYVGVTRAQEKLFIYYDRINFTSKRKPRRIQECEIIRNIPQTLYNREYL